MGGLLSARSPGGHDVQQIFDIDVSIVVVITGALAGTAGLDDLLEICDGGLLSFNRRLLLSHVCAQVLDLTSHRNDLTSHRNKNA